MQSQFEFSSKLITGDDFLHDYAAGWDLKYYMKNFIEIAVRLF